MFNPFKVPKPNKPILEMTDEEWQEFLFIRSEYKKKLNRLSFWLSVYSITVSTLAILIDIIRTN